MKSFLIAIMLAVSVLVAHPAYPKTMRTIDLRIDNCIVFRGEVREGTVKAVIDRLDHLVKLLGSNEMPIFIVLDTPGGNVDYGMELVKYVSEIPNVYFVAFVAGSMGAFMPQFLDRPRYMVKQGYMLMHEITFNCGPRHLADLQLCAEQATNEDMIFSLTVSMRMKIDLSTYHSFLRLDKWINSTEALEKNMIDEVVEIKCSKKLKDARISVKEYDRKGNILETLIYSQCPLIRNPI